MPIMLQHLAMGNAVAKLSDYNRVFWLSKRRTRCKLLSIDLAVLSPHSQSMQAHWKSCVYVTLRKWPHVMAYEISGRAGSRLPLLPQELYLSDDFIGDNGPPSPEQIQLMSLHHYLAKGVYRQLIPTADAYISSVAEPVKKLTFFLWRVAFVDLPPSSYIKGDPAWLQGCLSRTERSNELGVPKMVPVPINLVAYARSTWRSYELKTSPCGYYLPCHPLVGLYAVVQQRTLLNIE
ncbi:hypothetical protein EDC04DRAFT_2613273 [Pisolithus marmoratus]|nr:hypothetical protein EDC04DRAFT_2613273 [Pisolithus marmoratus]